MMYFFFVLVLLIPLMAVILDSQLGRALARRIEGGGRDATRENARLAALETEVDRLGKEMERLQEQAEFVTRLLEERREERLPGGEGG